ncbi:hypothetical protein QBC35DRAFT_523244 [Podospora australis]|uniref:Vacuolar sorting protein Vps3844 C-terminal domain-containing protein n=1 Tax=Podospora australis TaxID=1536484 RepID=A0AAN6WV71_9PEZI|nr:hypothetical protein QBC35DRAFT_523244 [Podospora australis]
MRLIAGLTAAALSGLAVGASQQSADVYIFSANQQSSTDTPSIPKEVARHILLQRTSRQRYGSDLRDIPRSIDTETAISHIARFGKGPEPLFTQDTHNDPSQLVVILEGVTPKQNAQLKETLAGSGHKAAFAVSDPPSAAANKNLMALFQHTGAASSQQCEFEHALNPINPDCWTGSSSAVKYDLQKSPSTFETLISSLPRIQTLTSTADLELTLLVLPESSRNSKTSSWSALAAKGANLARRDFGVERVITDSTVSHKNAPPTLAPNSPAAPKKGKKEREVIRACYESLDGCMQATGDCSGHGVCVNKYGSGGNDTDDSAPAKKAACFTCRCKPTFISRGDEEGSKGKKTVQWGGNKCQKEDISVQFWLITGFTIVIIGAVTFAISLLFNVGEEKLPGVIGAGVSRGSK